jgi:hypothetical protein
VLLLIMLPGRPVVGKPRLPGSFQASLAVFPFLFTAAAVLVVRGHVSHPAVQPHGSSEPVDVDRAAARR